MQLLISLYYLSYMLVYSLYPKLRTRYACIRERKTALSMQEIGRQPHWYVFDLYFLSTRKCWTNSLHKIEARSSLFYVLQKIILDARTFSWTKIAWSDWNSGVCPPIIRNPGISGSIQSRKCSYCSEAGSGLWSDVVYPLKSKLGREGNVKDSTLDMN